MCRDIVQTPAVVVKVDKDFTEISAIRQVFSTAAVELCLFHCLQAMKRELSKKTYNIPQGLISTLNDLFRTPATIECPAATQCTAPVHH